MIRLECLWCVKDSLRDVGISGMTINHVSGLGEQRGLVFTNRIDKFVVDEIDMVKVDVVMEDAALVETVIDVVKKTIDTKHPGNGRIFVIPVET